MAGTSLTKVHLWKNSILNGETLNGFPLTSRTRTEIFFTTSIQYFTVVPVSAISQEEEIKGLHIRKEKVKLFKFVDDMIIDRKFQGIY